MGHLSGPSGQGLFFHTALALDRRGLPLGIVKQGVWARKHPRGIAKKRHSRADGDKESQHWLHTVTAAEALFEPTGPGGPELVIIGDREADMEALFRMDRSPQTHFIVRARHNRALSGAGGADAFTAAA